jgi:two-component system response regulator AlgR
MIPRIFIVDDEAPARSRMKTLLSDIEQECPHQLVGEAGQAQAALDGIAQVRPDLVLLDVQMPGMTGLELAAHLAKDPAGAPLIIFVSAYDEYALKAFEVHALDYLLKPVRASRLAESIMRASRLGPHASSQTGALASASLALKSRRQNFSVQERGRLLLVPISDVVYLKAEAKYVTVRTKAREYLIEESLNSIEEEFGEVFLRVHRNALVARNALVGVERAPNPVDVEGEQDKGQDKGQEKIQESWQVILRDIDDRLPISRRQWPVVKALVK